MPTDFKTCQTCAYRWMTRADFLTDNHISLVGYQVNFNKLEAGLFLFNHNCGTTLSMQVKDFKDLYNGPIYRDRCTGKEECPGYCLRKDKLDPCLAKCECAFVREIMQLIKQIPKKQHWAGWITSPFSKYPDSTNSIDFGVVNSQFT